MFNDIAVDNTIESSGDILGGSKFNPLDSAIYEFTVKLAYGSMSKGKASALNLLLETTEGKEVRQQLWVTSGEAKGCLTYYVYTDKKTGKSTKKLLPGFELANDLCLMTINKPLNKTVAVDKTIMLYDYSQGKEVPTPVKMISELVGKKIYGGILKEIVDKTTLDPGTNEYVPTGETREINELNKFFHFPTGLTVTEAVAKMTEPKFKKDWAEKFNGYIKDKSTKTTAIPGAPASNSNPAAASGSSLFE